MIIIFQDIIYSKTKGRSDSTIKIAIVILKICTKGSFWMNHFNIMPTNDHKLVEKIA